MKSIACTLKYTTKSGELVVEKVKVELGTPMNEVFAAAERALAEPFKYETEFAGLVSFSFTMPKN